MDIKKLQSRNSSLDVIRILAVFMVMSVHFFLLAHSHDPAIAGESGFYYLPVEGLGPVEGIFKAVTEGDTDLLHGPLFFLMIMMRTFFTTCVPLFILLTGYLVSKKALSKSYYKGIVRIIIIFVIASIACFCFKAVHDVPAAKTAFQNGDYAVMFDEIHKSGKFGLDRFFLGILDFSNANYSWYVEMYIGLFLIAPFLNIVYNKLETKKRKQILVITCFVVIVLPSIINLYKFDNADWWMNPSADKYYQKLIPSWWTSIYPVAFYFTGAYIREFGIKLRTRSLVSLFCITLFLFTAFNWYRSYGNTFKSELVGWGTFETYTLSVMLFILLTRIKSDGWKPGVKWTLMKVSELTYGMYLISFIFDKLIYDELNKNVISVFDKLPFYLVTVPLTFILSLAASIIMNLMTRGIIKLYYKIKAFFKAQMQREDKMKWQDFLFIVLLLCGVLFSLWKCRYGFGGSDESFYLTIPRRLTMGDALFVNEWNLSQLSSILLVPFVWVFRTFTGSMDGIILAARVFYIIIHAAASTLIYVKLRKFGYISVFACALYFIFTPYDIMALSYDSMGLGLVTLTGVLIGTADYSKKLQIVFSGITLAGAVLCCPYLAVTYLLYAVCVALHYMLGGKNINFVLKSDMFSLKTFLFFTLGIGIPAVIFLAIVLPKAGINGIFENLPYMLDDPEHQNLSVWSKLGKYFESIFKMHPHFKYAIYSYCTMAVVMLFDRKRRLHRSIYLIISSAIVIFTYILLMPNLHKTTYNAIMLPLIFVGITSYVLIKNKPRELFAGLFVLGIIYSVCVHLPSNQYLYVISMAFAAVNVASLIFLGQLIREMRETPDNLTYELWTKRISFAMAAMLIILQGSFQITTKLIHCFWDGNPATLETEIEEGPAEGLITSNSNADRYTSLYEDISQYQNFEEDNILFLSVKSWMYLAADYPYGTYSAWLGGEKQGSIDRLREYYELNPDKEPRYIYVPLDSEWDMNSLLNQLSSFGYSYHNTAVGFMLEKIQ